MTIEPLRLSHSFAGSPEEVFDAWTNPEVLTRWWAMRPTWTSPGCEVDLRVGGRYRLQMQDDVTGQIYAVGGEYREIERPRRLVYTWRLDEASSLHAGHVSLVTIEFVPHGDRTTVLLEHGELPSAESVAAHSAGWHGMFDNLGARIFIEDPDTTTGGAHRTCRISS